MSMDAGLREPARVCWDMFAEVAWSEPRSWPRELDLAWSTVTFLLANPNFKEAAEGDDEEERLESAMAMLDLLGGLWFEPACLV